jgi:DNA-binding MarR family transcriptional regulator
MTVRELAGMGEPTQKTTRDVSVEEAFSALARLSDVGKYFRAYCYRSISEFGFSANEVDVLLSLQQHPEKNTVKGLSEAVHLSKGMISQAVERLRQRKMVTVDTDEHDRRAVRVHLAGESRPVLERLLGDYVDFVNRMFYGVSKERLADAFYVLKQLCHNKEEMKQSDKNEGSAATVAAEEHEAY